MLYFLMKVLSIKKLQHKSKKKSNLTKQKQYTQKLNPEPVEILIKQGFGS